MSFFKTLKFLTTRPPTSSGSSLQTENLLTSDISPSVNAVAFVCAFCGHAVSTVRTAFVSLNFSTRRSWSERGLRKRRRGRGRRKRGGGGLSAGWRRSLNKEKRMVCQFLLVGFLFVAVVEDYDWETDCLHSKHSAVFFMNVGDLCQPSTCFRFPTPQ